MTSWTFALRTLVALIASILYKEAVEMKQPMPPTFAPVFATSGSPPAYTGKWFKAMTGWEVRILSDNQPEQGAVVYVLDETGRVTARGVVTYVRGALSATLEKLALRLL